VPSSFPPPPSAFALSLPALRLSRIAGVDYGTVRIGIAISDPQQRFASPLENYARRTPALDAQHFARLAADEAISLWVVGLPVHLDGGEGEKSREARRFGQWLGEVTGIAVEFFDERFTSREAEQFLQDAGLTSKRRKKRMDMVAAQIMLSVYLESRTKGQEPPGALDS
jgi:putative Holliday junction resolvase